MQVGNPSQVASPLNFRLDTVADITSVPMSLAREVLALPDQFTDDQVKDALKSESKLQGHKPVKVVVANGAPLQAYPLTVPVEIVDKHGNVGEFEALIAFSEGQRVDRFLAGLSGFLDKFDLIMEPREFHLNARRHAGVNCPNSQGVGRAGSIP